MKLSMFILDAWFRDHGCVPVSQIVKGQPCLTSARFFHRSPGPNYVCLLNDCAPENNSDKEDCPILVNDHDIIRLPGHSMEQIADLLVEAFEYYTSWENSLLQKAISETTLQDLLDLAHLVMERPMNICNTRAWIYAITDGYGDYVHPHWKSYISNDTSFELSNDLSLEMKNRPLSKEGLPMVAYSTAYGGMVLYADIVADGERIGEIMAYENNRPFTEKDIQLMHVFQNVVTAYVQNIPGVLRSRSVLAEYFQNLLAQKPLGQYNLNQIITLSGWKTDDTFIILCAQTRKNKTPDMIGRLCDDLEDSVSDVHAFPYENLAVAIINLTRQESRKQLLSDLQKIIPKRSFFWGLSHECTGLESFSDYYRQALYTLEYAIRYRLPFSTMRHASIPCLREKLMQNPWLKTVLHPDFLTLIQYDFQNNTQYASSLYWYLFYSGNYTDAASQLNLHRNTLIYRINRIQEIIQFDLESINEKELFLLSYLLFQYDASDITANPE